MATQARRSRFVGPFLLSSVLCIGIIDYTVYSRTNSSLFSWLWSFPGYFFDNVSRSIYLSAGNLFLLGSIVLLGILLTRLSLSRALKAMRVNVADEVVDPAVLISRDKITKLKPKPLGKIFISYNRDASDGIVHLLYERLNKRFPGRILMDVTPMGARPDLARAIEEAVASCDIFLAMIGESGLSADRADSIEIAGALNMGIRVIPILVGNARMPAAEELAEDISAVARQPWVPLKDDSLVDDIERLIRILEQEFGENQPGVLEPIMSLFRPYWLVGGAVALAILVIVLHEIGIFRF